MPEWTRRCREEIAGACESVTAPRAATMGASLLTLISISFAALGLWRIGADLNWAGDFILADGFLSHWQVWVAAAVAVHYSSLQLTRYARASSPVEEPVAAENFGGG